MAGTITGWTATPSSSGEAIKPKREGGFLIAKVHQLAGRIFAKKLKAHGLKEINPAQGRILFVLWQKDGLPISELAKRTSLEKSTLTAMLDRLEKSGHLRRAPSPDDRRKTIIKSTAKNDALKAAYAKVSGEMTAEFYKGFSEKEMDGFERMLKHILSNLEGE